MMAAMNSTAEKNSKFFLLDIYRAGLYLPMRSRTVQLTAGRQCTIVPSNPGVPRCTSMEAITRTPALSATACTSWRPGLFELEVPGTHAVPIGRHLHSHDTSVELATPQPCISILGYVPTQLPRKC